MLNQSKKATWDKEYRQVIKDIFETGLFNHRFKRRSLPAALFLLTSAVSVACNSSTTKSDNSVSQSSTVNNSASPNVVDASAQGQKARIAIIRGPGPFYLAKVKGTMDKYLESKKSGVQWLGPFPAFSPAVEGLNAGSIDFTGGSTTAAISAMAGGSPFKIFGYQVSGKDGSGLLVQKDSPIGSVKDLVGKKVIVNRGGTGEYLLAKALEKNGVPLNKVERIYLGPADAAPVFTSGKADAWAVWGTFFATAAAQNGARVLATAGEIESENDGIYIVHNAFLEKHPDIVKAVYDVVAQESQWVLSNANQAMQIYGKEFKLSESVQKYMSQRVEGTPTPVGAKEIEKMNRVSDWFYKQGIIPKKPNIENFVVDVTKL
ncbi:aliphatic sulfonate ABC transporter substrate-binding protein [Nostoc sp. FACHB-145]|uniref:aliphatic sulfonate ABC transporter substrate-binding protein n=1 Tax=Nostoc sp. FACHB-145 TaxID=2692836 RepID=UPI00168822D9|nr:aliphatic sulfonate ABC transporter substrate-binding protein [Nostoc sp. FACHB-145]MBD2471406.1 aliphatic sulfonate ABC transporter substrate-binding protein [Nostoc sp. FACHB-145]